MRQCRVWSLITREAAGRRRVPHIIYSSTKHVARFARGEGAPFTGLKPAGRHLGPAIPAADEAVRVGSVEPVRRLLTDTMQHRLREEFAQVMSAQTFKVDDLTAGRASKNQLPVP